jgi:hypothetical protein
MIVYTVFSPEGLRFRRLPFLLRSMATTILLYFAYAFDLTDRRYL